MSCLVRVFMFVGALDLAGSRSRWRSISVATDLGGDQGSLEVQVQWASAVGQTPVDLVVPSWRDWTRRARLKGEVHTHGQLFCTLVHTHVKQIGS